MAKPKNTVDYFPHYCSHKTTMYVLEDTFQNDGYALWFKLLELLGRTPGHFIDCNSVATWRYILSCSHLSNDRATAILDLLADLDAIDKELWGYRVIWSKNFISNIEDVYKKRHTQLPPKPSTNGKNKYQPVTETIPMPVISEQNITETIPMPVISENNHTKELKELKELNNTPIGDRKSQFTIFKEDLKNSKNPVAVLVKAFELWHLDAPQEDFEHHNLYGYIGKMSKSLRNDYGYLLKIIHDTITSSISGSHLNYINAIVTKKIKQDKQVAVQKQITKGKSLSDCPNAEEILKGD